VYYLSFDVIHWPFKKR